ncbi:MAG: peptide chain release factor 1 [Acetobacterium sp.]
MLDKLDFLAGKYAELNEKISDPEIIGDQNQWRQLMKEQSHMQPIIEKYNEYTAALSGITDAKEMLADKQLESDFKEMAEAELQELTEQKVVLEEALRVLLLPKDPNDDKNVIVEVRAGAGGSEAALFAGDLFRMFTRYAERQGWKSEILSSSIPDIGGIKEIIFSIEGTGAFSRLKYESGVHRVQRIPTTESGGRIHTSTATVAVLPEAQDVEIDISANDLRIDVYRSSGNGGQSVNTTDSAVRITHLPTGMVATCQDEKSQLKNKDKALKILKARILEVETKKQQNEIAENRRSQVGTGDRSERIRTYNFPQGRISDHRIGMTVHQLDAFLDGDIDEMVNALITSDQAEKLKQHS